jgi:hypothetical protein
MKLNHLTGMWNEARGRTNRPLLDGPDLGLTR